jgi:phage terminase large subunit-like protein
MSGSNTELDKIISTLKTIKERQTYRKIDFYKPYPKQQAFHDAGASYRERLLMAANRVGKSYCGAAETAIHLTGEYPGDWLGRRWERPIKAWAIGETGGVTRDISQGLLCGEPGVDSALGSGMIPREAIDGKPSLARGVTDAFDTVQVKHLAPDGASFDGISVLRFKTYEQGRQKLQGESLDFFWCDEEPPQAEYSEIMTRIGDKDGCGIITFTPMQGMSKVVLRFLNEPSDTRFVIGMTIEDAEHIPPEKRRAIIDAYMPHEREARAKGIPMMGEGAVFTTPESMIMEPAIEYVPEHWSKLWNMDFGIAHPFAAVLSAWDKDADVFHVLNTIRMSDKQPIHHAKAIKSIAGNIPVGWPHDGNNREKGSGEVLSKLYRAEGLLTTPTHMTWPDGGVSVEAGIMEITQRMNSNRFKVAAHLGEWFEEYRLYHRKDGLIVATHNDLLDATRGGIMGKRYGKPLPLMGGEVKRRREGSVIAADVDFDIWAH